MQITFRHWAAVAAIALIPAFASATPVTLTFINGTASGSATITAATPLPVSGLGTYSAFGLNMKATPTGVVGDAAGNFVAWCLDLQDFLVGTSGYETTTTPFTNSYGLSVAEIARVQMVFDANFAGVNTADNTQAAGFQVALWNAIYDTDWTTTAGGIFDIAAGLVQTQANAFLLAASTFAGPQVYNLTFLESTSVPVRQNLVTVSPVPLPAAGWLLIAGLGGLAALRRKRKTA